MERGVEVWIRDPVSLWEEATIVEKSKLVGAAVPSHSLLVQLDKENTTATATSASSDAAITKTFM